MLQQDFLSISKGTKEIMVVLEPADKVAAWGFSQASNLLAQFLKSLSSFLQNELD